MRGIYVYFFDFKTINKLIVDNCYRQSKEFTLEDLSQYNESNGVVDILTNEPNTGFLIDDDYNSDMNSINFTSTRTTNRQVKQDTSKFTPDDWIRYITPLVTYALRETTQGMNTQRVYQKFILLGVLVGLGKTPQEAINQVQEWQNTGASQLLKGGTNTGISGGMGTQGNIGTSAGTMPTNRQVKQDTSKFTPDDWIRYITPLVTYSLGETTQKMDTKRAYQKFILLGVLVGLGKSPQEAITQVQEWQTTGASQLLKSGINTGNSAASGNIGTGATGTDGNISGSMGIEERAVLPPHLTSFKFANGGMTIGGGTGTSGGAMIPNSQVKQDISKFTPDDWIRYITPLVTYASGETTQGMNKERAYQKFILLGVLVGLGKSPQEAINQVQEWQTTGASQLLSSGTSAAIKGTTGGIGTGVTSTSGNTTTSGNTNKNNKLYFD